MECDTRFGEGPQKVGVGAGEAVGGLDPDGRLAQDQCQDEEERRRAYHSDRRAHAHRLLCGWFWFCVCGERLGSLASVYQFIQSTNHKAVRSVTSANHTACDRGGATLTLLRHGKGDQVLVGVGELVPELEVPFVHLLHAVIPLPAHGKVRRRHAWWPPPSRP